MNGAREEILSRVRSAQQAVKGEPVVREYGRKGALVPEERIKLFIDRLTDYNAVVHRCGVDEIATAIGAALRAHGKSGLLLPTGLPAEWLPQGFQFVRDDSLSYEQIDASEGVLTACALAIALTGTIVLRHSPGEGRRALTLIPDYHLCVVFEDQVVELVPEAMEQMGGFGRWPVTTISGPSATSDIEMTRVRGVHGPRTLEVVLANR